MDVSDNKVPDGTRYLSEDESDISDVDISYLVVGSVKFTGEAVVVVLRIVIGLDDSARISSADREEVCFVAGKIDIVCKLVVLIKSVRDRCEILDAANRLVELGKDLNVL